MLMACWEMAWSSVFDYIFSSVGVCNQLQTVFCVLILGLVGVRDDLVHWGWGSLEKSNNTEKGCMKGSNLAFIMGRSWDLRWRSFIKWWGFRWITKKLHSSVNLRLAPKPGLRPLFHLIWKASLCRASYTLAHWIRWIRELNLLHKWEKVQIVSFIQNKHKWKNIFLRMTNKLLF